MRNNRKVSPIRLCGARIGKNSWCPAAARSQQPRRVAPWRFWRTPTAFDFAATVERCRGFGARVPVAEARPLSRGSIVEAIAQVHKNLARVHVMCAAEGEAVVEQNT